MSNEPTWWISNDGQTTGPFTEAEIKQKLTHRALNPDQYVCRVGTGSWRRIAECAEFQEAIPAANTDYQAPRPPDAYTSKPPWNPQAIFWLGLLFTPIWTGILAALNCKRLGLQLPLWRPLAIGLGSFVASILWAMVGFDLGLMIDFVVFTIVPLIAIYNLDLAPQEKSYAEQKTTSQDHWIVPVLSGSPVAILILAGWTWTLFGPLEPLDVVKRFDASSTAKEARKYVTSNLYQMVADVEELTKLNPTITNNQNEKTELLTEYYDTNDQNQYFVDYRMYLPGNAGEPANTMEGYYHLRWFDRQWKIDEIMVTSWNKQPPDDGPISLSILVRQYLQEARRQPQTAPQKSSHSLVTWFKNLNANEWRALFIIGGLIVMGISRAFSKLDSPNNSK